MTKIIALDLDGTLLDDKKNISNNNIMALNDFLDAGNVVCIDTGRPIRAMKFLLEPYELFRRKNVYLLGFQGSLGYCVSENRYLFKNYLDKDKAIELITLALSKNLTALAFDEDKIYASCINDVLLRYNQHTNEPVKLFDSPMELLNVNICKIMIIDYEDKNRLVSIRDEFSTSAKGYLESMFSSPYFLEYIKFNTSKGQGLNNLCRRLNISLANAIAVGDECNDISMIKVAGIGVAMANANKEVKLVADYVTKNDNNNDAIAEVIKKWG